MITDQKVNAKFVGVYIIGDTVSSAVQIATTHKPNWFRRFFTKLLLGWDWISIAELRTIQGK